MKSRIPTWLPLVLLLGACQSSSPSQRPGESSSVTGMLPAGQDLGGSLPMPAARLPQGGPAMDEAAAVNHARELITREADRPRSHLRTIAETTASLARRGGMLESLDRRWPGVLFFVEFEGSFRAPAIKGVQNQEIYPFAAVVIEPRSGSVVSRTFYADRYRPQ